MPGRIKLKSLEGREVGKRGKIKKGFLKVEALGFSKILVHV
jgi:hypothetical protein